MLQHRPSQRTEQALFPFLHSSVAKDMLAISDMAGGQHTHADLHLLAATSGDVKIGLSHPDAAHRLTLDFVGMLVSYEVMEPGQDLLRTPRGVVQHPEPARLLRKALHQGLGAPPNAMIDQILLHGIHQHAATVQFCVSPLQGTETSGVLFRLAVRSGPLLHQT